MSSTGGARLARRRSGSWLLAVTAAMAVSLALGAEAWERGLERGGQLWVDPDTRRAYRSDGAAPRPMWDGVHRLDDGSTVIIHDGVAVPTEEMLDSWRDRLGPRSEDAAAPCADLVRRTCGAREECARSPGCLRARQLLTQERAEQRLALLAAGPRPETQTTATCRTAIDDATQFPPCVQSALATGGACEALVSQACGPDGSCGDRGGCGPARQLLEMQREAAQRREGPDALAEIEAQCAEAQASPFFAPCE